MPLPANNDYSFQKHQIRYRLNECLFLHPFQRISIFVLLGYFRIPTSEGMKRRMMALSDIHYTSDREMRKVS